MKSTPPTRHANFPGWSHLDTFRAAIGQVVGALDEAASGLPGARVDRPGDEPREPEFYATALRLPGDEHAGLRPAMLVYVLSPHWFAHEPWGEITCVAAIGVPTAAIGVRRFLRTWREGHLGGEVIYEGDLSKDSIRESGVRTLKRFLERRAEIDRRVQQVTAIAVWPIAGYAPRLCAFCLIPSGQGVCPRCGMPIEADRSTGPRPRGR